LLSCGIVLKFNYWPGSAALIAAGILTLSFGFLPMYFILKIQEKKETKEKVLIGLTSLVCIGMSLSVLFKVMHWPGANMLGIVSLCILVLLFLPVFVLTGIRNPDTKVNTIVSAVLIIAGSGLFLTLVSSPKSVQIKQEVVSSNLVRSEMILQSELRMFKRMHSNDTLVSNRLAGEITALCESIKLEIVKRETGYPALAGDPACRADNIHDGLVAPYFSGAQSLQPQLDELKVKIKKYNSQLPKLNLQPIPEDAITVFKSETTIPGYLNGLIQTEMFVIQNERELLASH
jgi:hypothetical protein